MSLSEACSAGYVLRQHGDYKVSNAYWHWCTTNVKPFIAISYTNPRQKYVSVEMDLLNTAYDGFGADAGYEILHTILGQPLKPKSPFSIGPTYISVWTTTPSAKALAHPAR